MLPGPAPLADRPRKRRPPLLPGLRRLGPARCVARAERGHQFLRTAGGGQPIGCWIRGVVDLDADHRIDPAADAEVGEAVEAGAALGGGFRAVERLNAADEPALDA